MFHGKENVQPPQQFRGPVPHLQPQIRQQQVRLQSPQQPPLLQQPQIWPQQHPGQQHPGQQARQQVRGQLPTQQLPTQQPQQQHDVYRELARQMGQSASASVQERQTHPVDLPQQQQQTPSEVPPQLQEHPLPQPTKQVRKWPPRKQFKGKVPTNEELNDLTINELKPLLKAFPDSKKTFKDKDELVQRLLDFYHRREVLDDLGLENDVSITIGPKYYDMEERRELFKVDEEHWNDIEFLEKADIPPGFTLDVMLQHITTFDVTIDGEDIEDDTERPAEKGRRLFMSNFIKRAWFIKTDSKLLIGCNVRPSMKTKMR